MGTDEGGFVTAKCAFVFLCYGLPGKVLKKGSCTYLSPARLANEWHESFTFYTLYISSASLAYLPLFPSSRESANSNNYSTLATVVTRI